MADSFRPPPWLSGPHLQTIAGSLWPTPPVGVDTQSLDVEVAPGNAVRLHVDHPQGRPRGTLLTIHGLCGSSESGPVRRIASAALGRGWVAARMNLRTCGGTERLSRTLYNAGQSDDVARALEALEREGFPKPFTAAAFSLGGNILLRYGGTSGAGCLLERLVAINPPIDLERCVRAIEQPRNRIYQLYYTLRLCRQHRRIQRARGLVGSPPRPLEIRTIRRFDDRFTAPDAGHSTAEIYYEQASASRRLADLRRPTLVLSASDDPYVPVEMFRPYRRLTSIRFLHPMGGGHCGYFAAGRPRFWAGAVALDFLAGTGVGRGDPP